MNENVDIRASRGKRTDLDLPMSNVNVGSAHYIYINVYSINGANPV